MNNALDYRTLKAIHELLELEFSRMFPGAVADTDRDRWHSCRNLVEVAALAIAKHPNWMICDDDDHYRSSPGYWD